MDTEQIKSGLKSTEFYVALLAGILPVLNKYLALDLPISSVISVASVALGYIASRTWLKKKSEL